MQASDLHLRHRRSRLHPHPAGHPDSWAVQLRWFAIAAVVAFAVPFVASGVLALQHDAYLGIYLVAVLALCAAYAVATRLDVRATLARHCKLGLPPSTKAR